LRKWSYGGGEAGATLGGGARRGGGGQVGWAMVSVLTGWQAKAGKWLGRLRR
jgi:hypothetical protein